MPPVSFGKLFSCSAFPLHMDVMGRCCNLPLDSLVGCGAYCKRLVFSYVNSFCVCMDCEP